MLFSKAFRDFVSRCEGSGGEDVTRDFDFFTGNYGLIRDLRTGKLQAVPPERVLDKGQTPDQAMREDVVREHQAKVLKAFVSPLSDDEVKKHVDLAGLRDYWREQGVSDDVMLAHHVRAGYTMRRIAPLAGKCRQDLNYLQDWDYPGQPTSECLILGLPIPPVQTFGLSVDQQFDFLAGLRKELHLPKFFFRSFGNVDQDALLIQTHHLETREKEPKNGKRIRTDTCLSDGPRLRLRWDGGELDCVRWLWDDDGYGYVGCLALGVKVLGR